MTPSLRRQLVMGWVALEMRRLSEDCAEASDDELDALIANLYSDVTEDLIIAFGSLAEGIAELAIYLDHIFLNLEKMAGRWPEPGEVDRHGIVESYERGVFTMAGNNPHVFFPVHRPYVPTKLPSCFGRTPNVPSVYPGEGGTAMIRDSLCPCGLWQSVFQGEFRRIEAVEERAWRPAAPAIINRSIAVHVNRWPWDGEPPAVT